MANLTFKNAEDAKEAIMASQKKEIVQLYNKWADEIGERAKFYSHKSNASAPLSERYYKELQKQLRETSQEVSNEIYKNIKSGIYMVSDAVVKDNVEWLKSFGFPADGLGAAFSFVPNDTVQRLVTGQIYEGGWNLSSRIWGDNEQTLKDIYEVMAKGLAENKPIYDIAKDLEKYVRPSASLPWNLTMGDGRRIYKKQVDYNAQRLARTLTQHAYQQSFIAVTQNNPFVEDYIWHANGSRVCELCEERDGQHFKKDELPMDHPNGMCVMEPNVDNEKMKDQLADWIKSSDGSYPEIDEFASKFGYVPGVSQLDATQKKWLEMAGYTNGQMPKDFSEFAHKLTYDQQSELLKAAGGDWNVPHPFQMMEKYYNANIAQSNGASVKTSVGNVTGVDSLGTSKGKTFNNWYMKLDAEQKLLAQQLKNSSGLTWQQWYEKNIYTGGAIKTPQAKVPMDGSLPKGAIMYDQKGRTIRSLDLDGLKRIFLQQTESDMLAMEARAFAKMTNGQSDGIVVYTGYAYEKINDYLRKRAIGLSVSLDPTKKIAMKNAQAGLTNASLEKAIVVRRGTDLGDLAGFMPGNFDVNLQMLSSMSIDELNARFAGTVGKYVGFTSTSSQWDRGFDGNVEVIMTVPEGAQASSIMSVSRFGTGEGETLLNSGTMVYIDRIEKSDGHFGSDIRVFMDVIGVAN